MNTSPIFFLRIIKKIRTNIDGHFVLKSKDHFQVFTSKPLSNIKTHKVSDTNIKGEQKPQYLADNVHRYNQNEHQLTQTKECYTYYNEHRTDLYPFEKKLDSLTKINEQ